MESKVLFVNHARRHIGSTKWNDTSLLNYSKNEGFNLADDLSEIDKRILVFGFKCNLFVSDMAKLAGIHTWLNLLNVPSINMPSTDREPTAKEWYSRDFILDGWRVAENALPGDVASNGVHMGIVAENPKMLISASSTEGKVNILEWGDMKAATKRRFVGLTEADIINRAALGSKSIGSRRCF